MILREFRPIDTWPWPFTEERARSPFSAGYTDTLGILDRELRHLGAERLVICMALPDSQIRNDRQGPYADARPEHPGVMVVVDSHYGPLRYATDRFRAWQGNLRAIALGLEALRKVDRYGITRAGEQYRGFAALPGGTGSSNDARLLAEWSGLSEDEVRADPRRAFRLAARKVHPDAGGDPETFAACRDAMERLGAMA